MKKAIFQRFIMIVSLALVLCGSIFGVAISWIIIARTEENMLYTVRIMDHGLEYDENLKTQVDELKLVKGNEMTRFTVIDLQGRVVADSEVSDSAEMENHSDREEVAEALASGIGYSRRRSETLDISMLYVASISYNGDYIVRMAVPFSGAEQYTGLLIPAILISIGITLLLSVVVANRFADSVTRPLKEIAGELNKLSQEKPEFHFKKYDYEEMNVIADTTMKMSQAVKESMDRIEFERMVRQEFFSNASHELKTPLTSIRGYLELLENNLVTDENSKRDFLIRIKKETSNMTNLINDILMISRLETKEAEVTLSDVRLAPLVKEVCASLEPLAREYQVSIESNCRPLMIYANMQQMRELLNNLMVNAIKYNKPMGKVWITVSSEQKDIIITVEDTGVGIPEDARQRIFERFYRVDKGRSKKVGGTGLGLSIVKHIVNYYGGSVELESRVMEGSKFTVRLPKEPVKALGQAER
ncbi:two-component system phosphate regulon sensor histidine kinase PhoR [Anaerotaenia torta]|uniref:sensor histidine kinase n=1 Tax=Anaerotaenia torta TaxID=433293 RepID=UPI003D225E06